MSSNNALFLLGGTGGLGQEVAKGLMTAEGFGAHKAIVRDVSKAKPLADLGWTLVAVSDFKDPDAMEKALAGAKVVVSTFGGGEMVYLEKTAVTAAKKAGASLFVPSQFGVDYRRWGFSFPFLAGKKVVVDFAEEQGLPTLKVFCGLFGDWIFGFYADIENGTATVVGDGDFGLCFTRRSDIGYVLAKALEDPKYKNGGFLSMSGDHKTLKEAYGLLEKATEKKLKIETIDPQDALKQEQELLRKGLEGDMGAFYGSFKLHLLGEPARGNTGGDVSEEANNYGVKLETLEETLQMVYGQK